MSKKRIYIAGPLNAQAIDYIKNCHIMSTYAESIRRRGFSVYVPCLDFMLGYMFGTWDYDDYFDNSQPWLIVSDAVFLCPGWRESKGCKREFMLAGECNIPTFESVNALIGYFEEHP